MKPFCREKVAGAASYPDVSLLKRQWERKGGRERLFFLPVVPRASRSSPAARPSRSSRETPEEEAEIYNIE